MCFRNFPIETFETFRNSIRKSASSTATETEAVSTMADRYLDLALPAQLLEVSNDRKGGKISDGEEIDTRTYRGSVLHWQGKLPPRPGISSTLLEHRTHRAIIRSTCR